MTYHEDSRSLGEGKWDGKVNLRYHQIAEIQPARRCTLSPNDVQTIWREILLCCSINVLPINSWTHGTCAFPHGEWNGCPDSGTASSKDQACPNLYWWLRHEIGIISPTEGDTIWTNLMSISAMKLPHTTASLHPSRIRPLASRTKICRGWSFR